MSIDKFMQKKGKEKLAFLTAYDYVTARILNDSKIDGILVGDSLGMVFQGNSNTLSVSMDEMVYHTKIVKKGAPDSFLIADMPYLSYHISKEETIINAGRLIREGGAEAVKLEGGIEIIDNLKALIAAKIPVMGHLGLTPQSVNIFGGYKVQGKSLASAKKMISDALALQEAGVFSFVLECIPEELAKIITDKLIVPTIGIGAGRYVDGQILVINDAFGTYTELAPKFSKVFANVFLEMKKGITGFIEEVKNEQFPDESHIFTIDKESLKELL